MQLPQNLLECSNDAYYLMDESCHYGEDYTAALAYLMEFAPDVQREKFEYRIQNLMESEHWIQLIDLAIERVRTFTSGGTYMQNFFQKLPDGSGVQSR